MNVEGVGKRAPCPVTLIITPAEARAVFSSTEFSSRYDASTGAWSRSVLDPTNPRKAVEVGVLGEHALASWLRLHTGQPVYPDLKYHKRGGGAVDLKPSSLGIQLKTRVGDHRKATLVKTTQVDGWDILVGAQLREIEGVYELSLLGWLPQVDVIECPKDPGFGGFWWNYAVPDCDLLPMRDLPAEVRNEGELNPLPWE